MTFGNMRRSAQQNRDDLQTGCGAILALPPIALVVLIAAAISHFLFGWPQ